MRKYLLNAGVITAALAVIPAMKNSQRSRSTWVTVAAWIAWGATLAGAIAAVREETLAERDELETR